MKNPKIFFLILLQGIMSISCSNSGDDDGAMAERLSVQIENNVKTSTWRITKFIDSGNDETNHFIGYNFKFSNSGVLNASNESNNYEGSWNISDSNSSDDNQNDVDFNIYFNLTNDFEDLNDDWDVVSQSSNKIELIDVSGGNGGTDYLTFEKN
jgi:hypothetical protein